MSNQVTYSGEPILQLIKCKNIGCFPNVNYCVWLSDGKHHQKCMLSKKLNHLVDDGELEKNKILKLKKYVKSSLNSGNKKEPILILVEFDPVLSMRPPLHSSTNVLSSPQQQPILFSKRNSEPNPFQPTLQPIKNAKKPIVLIDALNEEHNQKSFQLKARVVLKKNIHFWKKAQSNGKSFTMDLMDASGKIRAVAFNEEVDKFYPMIEVRKKFCCYYKFKNLVIRILFIY